MATTRTKNPISASDGQGATRHLAEYLTSIRPDVLTDELREKLKLHVLDSLGTGLHGSTTPWNRQVRDVVLAWGGQPEAWVWGSGERVPAPAAVQVNAMAAHSFELDDSHVASHVHPGGGTVATALAVAQAAGGELTDDEALVAILAGYEASIRIGLAVAVGAFERGFYPPGITIAFGAAATAGKLYNFDATLMSHCLALTATQAAGLYSPTSVKRFNIGHGARSGLVAAQLVRGGLRGVEDSLEAGVGGFARTFPNHVNWQPLMPSRDEEFMIWKTGLKRYSCSRPNHTAIDAVVELREKRGGLSPDELERIEIECSTPSYRYGHEFEVMDVPRAFMSIGYCTAAMAVYGDVFVDQFTEEAVRNPAIKELLRRTEVKASPEIDAMGPASRDTVHVTFKLRDGDTYRTTVHHGTGQPPKPLPAEEIRRKFVRLAALAVDEQQALALLDAVDRLGEGSINEVIDLLHV